MKLEELQELIIKIYKNELKHEEKYDKQFEKLMDKYEDILYGKIARIYKGREITNKDLYGPNNLLLKFSDAIESVLDNFYKELNFNGKLYQASLAVKSELKTALNVKIKTDKETIDKQINETNSIDGLNLSDRLAKSKNEFYNKLMNTIVINVAQKKSQFQVSNNIADQIRGLLVVHGRLMGTEMNRILNETLLNIYRQLGIKNVEFSAVLDSKTSYTCTMHNGRVYAISELIHGVTQPPLHPNCRSILLPHE